MERSHPAPGRLATLALVGGLLVALAPAPCAAQGSAGPELPADVPALTPVQREVYDRVVAATYCYCGCPHTLAGCLREHGACKHAPRMATLIARLAVQGLAAPEIRKAVADYYGGFDRARRARLDLKEFGPPKGNADARVAMVEFSDFTCPFCQRVKPQLDKFVAANPGRVRLYYKPFPIPSHAHAFDAASAGEWARDRGLFWKMYDQLFMHPRALAPDDLAGYAASLGGDPEDLRKAIASERYRPRILAAQAEARTAGIIGTPTIFLDGRRLDLPWPTWDADIQEMLDFAVADEEEWAANRGWARD